MIKILILLKNKKKIFYSYSGKILFEYLGELFEDKISVFIKKEYNLNSLKSDITQLLPDLSIVEISLCDESYKGEFIPLSRALKLLENTDYNNAIKNYFESQRLKSNIKLKYGLRNNKIICISDIQENEKGLKCNCLCPGCGLPLQAKLGHGKKQRHFSHNNAACDTIVAQQTALHLLAKEIIEKEKKICFPPIIIGIDEIPENIIEKDNRYALPKKLVYCEAKTIHCDNVVLEKKISNIVPDIIIEKSGRKCLVEIAVTHFVDDDKSERIRQLDLPVLEIDLSSIYGAEISQEAIRKIIIDNSEFKKWIYNPIKNKAIEWASNKYVLLQKEHIQQKREREIAAQKIRELETIKERQKVAKREKAESIIKQLQKPENYRASILKLRNDGQYHKSLKKRTFYKDSFVDPFFFDIPITGEIVFDCDRRIWQSAIFDKFVFNRSESYVKTTRIFSWATKYQNEFKINWELVPKTFLPIKNQAYFRSLLHECIKQYLEYLSIMEFISPVIYGEATVQSKHNLNPPNKEKAAELKGAINSVDQYSWDVTDQINRILFPYKVYVNTLPETSNHSNVNYRITSVPNIKMSRNLIADRIIYDEGMEEIINNNLFEKEEIVKDSYGKRWLICSNCGQIKREDEMVSYQGKTGICRECERDNKV